LDGVAHEAAQRASFTDAAGLAPRLAALLLEPCEGLLQVADGERDVPVARAEVVRTAVVVERQLELLVLAGNAEEVVRGLRLAVADDVHVATELEPERLVEGA